MDRNKENPIEESVKEYKVTDLEANVRKSRIWNKTEKKQLLIFCLIAFGITYVLGILMWYGQKNGLDISAFPNAQMMYPASGVMAAYLLTAGKEQKLPKAFYCVYLLLTAAMIACALLSVFMPDAVIMSGSSLVSIWTYVIQIVMLAGSILCWILLLASGKEKRKAFGLSGSQWKTSILMIALFLALYFFRTFLSYALAGVPGMFGLMMGQPESWIYLAVMPVNFIRVMVPFFGEEYGWRYYLQPLLQKRFGLRGGVIILGIVWGLWHLPVDFFYYSPGYGLQAAVSQQITCITLGIFFAYAYMKTNNIWVPVMLHYINNNLVPVIAGDYSASVLENQVVTWETLLPALLLNGILFGSFLLSKTFSGNNAKEISGAC